MRKIVVIGAGAAGMAAATRARRTDPKASITILEASSEYARGTCSLAYYVSGEISSGKSLIGADKRDLAERGIELQLESPVLAIDPLGRTVRLARKTIPYDRLVVGLGSRSRKIPVVNIEANAHSRLWTLRSIKEADHIKNQLLKLQARRIAIVGGGYVGLEVAEALSRRGCEVTIFHRQSTLMRLHTFCHTSVESVLESRGIRAELNAEVCLIDPDSRDQTVTWTASDKNRLSEGFDAVVASAGVVPETELLVQAGARLGPSGGVLVTLRGETSLDNIYAAGDGVEVPNPKGGGSRAVALATAAARLGRVCGENAAGGSRRVGSLFSCLAVRLFDTQVATVGHPEDWKQGEALEVSFGSDESPFWPRREGRGIFFLEPRSQRLLGAQFVAPQAANLADLASLAMEKNMTLDDLQDLDYSYTPPLSALWHPFYLASRQAERELRHVKNSSITCPRGEPDGEYAK